MYAKVNKARRVYLMGDNGLILSMSQRYATDWNAKRAARRMFPDLDKIDANGKKFV